VVTWWRGGGLLDEAGSVEAGQCWEGGGRLVAAAWVAANSWTVFRRQPLGPTSGSTGEMEAGRRHPHDRQRPPNGVQRWAMAAVACGRQRVTAAE
jgi:hypothetical protein